MRITSRGVDVTVLDIGTYLHGDFKDRVATFADFVNHHTPPCDGGGHGTHIAAMIEGSGIFSGGRYEGVMSGCSLVSVKVLGQKGSGYATDIPTRSRWIRENRNRYNIRVVSISIGSLSCGDMTENSILVRGASTAWGDDLVVVVAARDHGPGRVIITAPGISHKAITVGCSDDHKEVNVVESRMVNYSGGDPTLACVHKPDLVTPDSRIISCCNEPGRYFSRLGISMSAPLMPGVIALLLEKYPDISNEGVELHIRERAPDLGPPHNQ